MNVLLSRTSFVLYVSLFLLVVKLDFVRAAENLRLDLGQPPSEHFDTMKITGDPQNFSIKQDNKGSIYMGNGRGLLVFDGNNWQTLTIGIQTIRDFILLENGKILVGAAGNIGVFEKNDVGQFEYHSFVNESLADTEISDVFQLLRVNEHTLILTEKFLYSYHPELGFNLVKNITAPIFALNMGNEVLISHNEFEVSSFNVNDLYKPEVQLSAIDIPYSFEDEFIGGFVEVENKGVIAYSPERIYQRDVNNEFVPWETEVDGWIEEFKVERAIEISGGRLALGTERGGVAIIDLNGKLERVYNNSHGLKDNSVNFLFQDRDGHLWISSASKGVTRVELDSPISIYPSDDEFYISASIVEFLGQVFMGAQHGLFKLESAETLHKQADFKKLDFELGSVMTLIPDSKQLLVGHYGGVSVLTQLQDSNFELKPVHIKGVGNGSAIRRMIRLEKEPNKILAASRDGVVLISKKNDQWESQGLLKNLSVGIFTIVEDNQGEIWMGDKVGQFYKVKNLKDWPNLTVEKIDYPLPETPIFASVFSLDEHVLFENGYRNTVSQLEHHSQKIVPSTITNWDESSVHGVIELSQVKPGKAWFLTMVNDLNMLRLGQLKRTMDDQYLLSFDALDKMDLQYTLNLYVAQNEDVWIPSQGKVVRYQADLEAKLKDLPAPMLSKISDVSTLPLFVNNEFESVSHTVFLKPTDTAIKLDFSSGQFSHRKTTQYRYRFSDHQPEWSDWEIKPNTTLTGLGPGEHLLEIQYRTSPTRVSPITRTLIHRQAYWYQTGWAQFVIGVILLSIIYLLASLIARYKNQQLTNRARLLESEVDKRTAIIQTKSEQLERQNKQLVEMDAAKSRFFANISHEFRTPLTLAIAPVKQILESGNIKNETTIDYLQTALKNNIHMLSLLEQLLDINKLESGKVPLRITQMELVANLNYCIERFLPNAKLRGISFLKQGFDKEYPIYFDLDHFEKIFVNLLSNAIKFSRDGSNIEVNLYSSEKSVDIKIKDFGLGILPDELPFVFDRYYQGEHSAQVQHPGTGIGLALVKELLTLHEARISVDSRVNEFTQFSVSLLRGFSHYQQLHVSHERSVIDLKEKSESVKNFDYLSQRKSKDKQNDHKSKTLLVVDDNSDVRYFIRKYFDSNYRVLDAENGQQGLEIALTEQPDIIISDVMMPVMDGIQLIKTIRAKSELSHIPTILLSAKTTRKDTIEGLTFGADDYIYKPFDSSELIARVEAILASKRRIADKLYKEYSQQQLSDNLKKSFKDDFSIKLEKLIDSRMNDETFDVEQMYKGMNTTRSTLLRQVKASYNTTPSELLKQRRLDVSLKLLRESNGSVSEIGYAVGFKSLSAYSRAFREYYGVPPSKFPEISMSSEGI